MTIDKKVTQDLFGYKSVPCLECDGTGEEPKQTKTQKTVVTSVMEWVKL
jgi:hypothetical protein